MSSKGRYFAHISIDLYCLRTESAASFFALSLFDCSLSISPPSGVDGIQISFRPVATGGVRQRAALACIGGRLWLLGGKIGPLPGFLGLQTCMVTIVCYGVVILNQMNWFNVHMTMVDSDIRLLLLILSARYCVCRNSTIVYNLCNLFHVTYGAICQKYGE